MPSRNVRSRLVELGNSGYEIVADEPDIRKWKVTNADRKLLGVVDELLVDRELHKVRYIVLGLHGKPLNLLSRKVLIPIGIAELDQVDEAAKKLIDNGWCQAVVVSLGAAGAMLATKNHFIHYKTPTIKKRSTVGAGDSMVAGIVWALQSGFPNEDVVAWGVACGSAATMNEGTRLFKKADAEKLFKWVKSHS